MEIKSVARAEGATVPTKIYSFGLTTFPPKKKNQNITEKFPLKAFVVAVALVVGKLIRRSEACAANWYTLTLHWFTGSGTCAAAVAIRLRQKAAKKASIQQEGRGGR